MSDDNITSDEAWALRTALKQLQTALDVLSRERDGLLAEVERLREALAWYADTQNHFHVERRNPGDPDPAVICVWEPPIMSDGGHRARKALEVAP